MSGGAPREMGFHQQHFCAVWLPGARAIGSTESERTPWAPWISTPSMSAAAEGPV